MASGGDADPGTIEYSSQPIHTSSIMPSQDDPSNSRGERGQQRNRSDSNDLLNEYAKIPIALRAQVEAWELNRSEIVINDPEGG
eukprot:CAMPEP_0174915828 /NCGR_PEP_ID=MMETSP1355-20121228/1398_1 /TAXON_ID=464990 /ORGANISM="Hemiselmis tepida, Strain CCMP443" /LENGTH=83 /DNA_ID=CAMNT_0016160773 /DNA_START=31 /DNA_END=278 /DNA_ORIENTATION=-